MRFSTSEETESRVRSEALGMPACGECALKKGDLEEGGIWVEVDAGLVGRKKWVKREWTVEMGGKEYAVGQDRGHRVIAYAPAGTEGSLFSIGSITSMVIRYSLLAVVLAVWSITGFFFWIPLIARATAVFCVTAVYANLLAHDADVPNRGLQHAAFFYVNGFCSIYRAIIEPHSGEPETMPAFRLGRFLAEAFWSILFWWITLFTLAYLGVAFAAYQSQLADPFNWLVEQVSAGWDLLQQGLDVLLESLMRL